MRIRWSDRAEEDDAAVDWRYSALIIATLFLNGASAFWLTNEGLADGCSFATYAAVSAGETVLLTLFFFLGPALQSRRSPRPLNAVERSIGLIPAVYIGLCCVLFLVTWIATLNLTVALRFVAFLWERQATPLKISILAALILTFLFWSGTRGWLTSARLALFTNKLGIALLIAALVRVHQGWPAIPYGFPSSQERSLQLDVWNAFCTLTFATAPLGFLAATFACRARSPKDIAVIANWGFAVPLVLVLVAGGAISVATWASPYYVPSVNPNVMMALWAHAALSSLPPRMIIFGISTFGAVRLGVKALRDASPFGGSSNWRWLMLACLIGVIAWLVGHPDGFDTSAILEGAATSLAIASAILTADFISASNSAQLVRKVDWIGTIALLAGLLTFVWLRWSPVSIDRWPRQWIWPSCGAAFAVCLLGRAVNRIAMRVGKPGNPSAPFTGLAS